MKQVYDYEQELVTLNQLEVVHTILELLCKTTGMRIALVSQSVNDMWTACAIVDEAGWGYKVGDHLDLQKTY